jgi:hypothetical protein
MRMTSRTIWIIVVVVVLLLLLPLPIAERYTSPTQDGQYMLNPLRAYRFVLAAIRVSPDSELNTSGKALNQAKDEFPAGQRPTKVELLFFPESESYSYSTPGGKTLTLPNPPQFVWEVWGVSSDEPSQASEVIGFMSYETGEMLSSVES